MSGFAPGTYSGCVSSCACVSVKCKRVTRLPSPMSFGRTAASTSPRKGRPVPITDRPAKPMAFLRVQVLIIFFHSCAREPHSDTAGVAGTAANAQERSASLGLFCLPEELIPRILRFAAVGPVFDFWWKVGTRLVSEIFRDIDRVLIRQGTALAERRVQSVGDGHVVLDEGRGGICSRHTRSDVERSVPPKRRKDKLVLRVLKTFAVDPMAFGAFRFIKLLT